MFIPHLQILHKCHHVPKCFRYLEFLFEPEAGIKFPVCITTVEDRGRVFTNSSPSDGGDLEALSLSLGIVRTGS